MFLWLGLFGLGLLSGPLPSKGLVLGRCGALLRMVQLGGPWVRRARANAVDAHDAADVFLYRDSSIAPLLDMRRRFKSIINILDAMIRHGTFLSRSVELTAQWDEILAVGPLHPVTLDDLHAVEGSGLGDFHRVVGGVHHRLRFMRWLYTVRMKLLEGGVIG